MYKNGVNAWNAQIVSLYILTDKQNHDTFSSSSNLYQFLHFRLTYFFTHHFFLF